MTKHIDIDALAINMTQMIRDGIAITYAAPACGISRDTHYDYLRDGEKDYRLHLDTSKSRYYQSVSQVKADFIKSALDNIKRAGLSIDKWQANAWLLERLYGFGYGKECEEMQQLQKDLQLIKNKLGLNDLGDPSESNTLTTEHDSHGSEKEMDPISDQASRRSPKEARSKRGRKDFRSKTKESRKVKKPKDKKASSTS